MPDDRTLNPEEEDLYFLCRRVDQGLPLMDAASAWIRRDLTGIDPTLRVALVAGDLGLPGATAWENLTALRRPTASLRDPAWVGQRVGSLLAPRADNERRLLWLSYEMSRGRMDQKTVLAKWKDREDPPTGFVHYSDMFSSYQVHCWLRIQGAGTGHAFYGLPRYIPERLVRDGFLAYQAEMRFRYAYWMAMGDIQEGDPEAAPLRERRDNGTLDRPIQHRRQPEAVRRAMAHIYFAQCGKVITASDVHHLLAWLSPSDVHTAIMEVTLDEVLSTGPDGVKFADVPMDMEALTSGDLSNPCMHPWAAARVLQSWEVRSLWNLSLKVSRGEMPMETASTHFGRMLRREEGPYNIDNMAAPERDGALAMFKSAWEGITEANSDLLGQCRYEVMQKYCLMKKRPPKTSTEEDEEDVIALAALLSRGKITADRARMIWTRDRRVEHGIAVKIDEVDSDLGWSGGKDSLSVYLGYDDSWMVGTKPLITVEAGSLDASFIRAWHWLTDLRSVTEENQFSEHAASFVNEATRAAWRVSQSETLGDMAAFRDALAAEVGAEAVSASAARDLWQRRFSLSMDTIKRVVDDSVRKRRTVTQQAVGCARLAMDANGAVVPEYWDLLSDYHPLELSDARDYLLTRPDITTTRGEKAALDRVNELLAKATPTTTPEQAKALRDEFLRNAMRDASLAVAHGRLTMSEVYVLFDEDKPIPAFEPVSGPEWYNIDFARAYSDLCTFLRAKGKDVHYADIVEYATFRTASRVWPLPHSCKEDLSLEERVWQATLSHYRGTHTLAEAAAIARHSNTRPGIREDVVREDLLLPTWLKVVKEAGVVWTHDQAVAALGRVAREKYQRDRGTAQSAVVNLTNVCQQVARGTMSLWGAAAKWSDPNGYQDEDVDASDVYPVYNYGEAYVRAWLGLSRIRGFSPKVEGDRKSAEKTRRSRVANRITRSAERLLTGSTKDYESALDYVRGNEDVEIVLGKGKAEEGSDFYTHWIRLAMMAEGEPLFEFLPTVGGKINLRNVHEAIRRVRMEVYLQTLVTLEQSKALGQIKPKDIVWGNVGRWQRKSEVFTLKVVQKLVAMLTSKGQRVRYPDLVHMAEWVSQPVMKEFLSDAADNEDLGAEVKEIVHSEGLNGLLDLLYEQDNRQPVTKLTADDVATANKVIEEVLGGADHLPPVAKTESVGGGNSFLNYHIDVAQSPTEPSKLEVLIRIQPKVVLSAIDVSRAVERTMRAMTGQPVSEVKAAVTETLTDIMNKAPTWSYKHADFKDAAYETRRQVAGWAAAIVHRLLEGKLAVEEAAESWLVGVPSRIEAGGGTVHSFDWKDRDQAVRVWLAVGRELRDLRGSWKRGEREDTSPAVEAWLECLSEFFQAHEVVANATSFDPPIARSLGAPTDATLTSMSPAYHTAWTLGVQVANGAKHPHQVAEEWRRIQEGIEPDVKRQELLLGDFEYARESMLRILDSMPGGTDARTAFRHAIAYVSNHTDMTRAENILWSRESAELVWAVHRNPAIMEEAADTWMRRGRVAHLPLLPAWSPKGELWNADMLATWEKVATHLESQSKGTMAMLLRHHQESWISPKVLTSKTPRDATSTERAHLLLCAHLIADIAQGGFEAEDRANQTKELYDHWRKVVDTGQDQGVTVKIRHSRSAIFRPGTLGEPEQALLGPTRIEMEVDYPESYRRLGGTYHSPSNWDHDELTWADMFRAAWHDLKAMEPQVRFHDPSEELAGWLPDEWLKGTKSMANAKARMEDKPVPVAVFDSSELKNAGPEHLVKMMLQQGARRGNGHELVAKLQSARPDIDLHWTIAEVLHNALEEPADAHGDPVFVDYVYAVLFKDLTVEEAVHGLKAGTPCPKPRAGRDTYRDPVYVETWCRLALATGRPLNVTGIGASASLTYQGVRLLMENLLPTDLAEGVAVNALHRGDWMLSTLVNPHYPDWRNATPEETKAAIELSAKIVVGLSRGDHYPVKDLLDWYTELRAGRKAPVLENQQTLFRDLRGDSAVDFLVAWETVTGLVPWVAFDRDEALKNVVAHSALIETPEGAYGELRDDAHVAAFAAVTNFPLSKDLDNEDVHTTPGEYWHLPRAVSFRAVNPGVLDRKFMGLYAQVTHDTGWYSLPGVKDYVDPEVLRYHYGDPVDGMEGEEEDHDNWQQVLAHFPAVLTWAVAHGEMTPDEARDHWGDRRRMGRDDLRKFKVPDRDAFRGYIDGRLVPIWVALSLNVADQDLFLQDMVHWTTNMESGVGPRRTREQAQNAKDYVLGPHTIERMVQWTGLDGVGPSLADGVKEEITGEGLVFRWLAAASRVTGFARLALLQYLPDWVTQDVLWKALLPVGKAGDPVAVMAEGEKPSLATRAWDVLRTDAQEIALRTGVKRFRSAAQHKIAQWWAQRQCPRMAEETDDAYRRRLEAAVVAASTFLRSDAAEPLLALSMGFLWGVTSDTVTSETVKVFGDAVAREMRLSAGTDLLDGFLDEVFEPVVDTLRGDLLALPTGLRVVDVLPEAADEDDQTVAQAARTEKA